MSLTSPAAAPAGGDVFSIGPGVVRDSTTGEKLTRLATGSLVSGSSFSLLDFLFFFLFFFFFFFFFTGEEDDSLVESLESSLEESSDESFESSSSELLVSSLL